MFGSLGIVLLEKVHVIDRDLELTLSTQSHSHHTVTVRHYVKDWN